MHKLEVEGLDSFEAEHVAQILQSYEGNMIAQMVEAHADGDKNRVQWIDEHLKWHREIMGKIVWRKTEG